MISRSSDGNPFYGGDAIDDQWGRCTSGANVVDAHGVPYAVTAAHCGGITDDYTTGGANQDVYTSLKVSGSAGTYLRQEGLQVGGATTGITRGYAVIRNNANVCYGGTHPKNTCVTSGRGIELGNACRMAKPGDSGGGGPPVPVQPLDGRRPERLSLEFTSWT
ncbi:hypothetical protein OK074_0123 [Actinobacteria bacterium OK074]|nr:hypothetical protein OK074_0123 [Actinobacteria bacterium OK074]